MDNLTRTRMLASDVGPMKKFPLVSLAAVTVTAACFLLLFDPFHWLAGTPPVHDAKKRVALSLCLILFFGLPGIWLMIICPIQTGVTSVLTGNRSSARRNLLRSEEPLRFRLNVIFNAIIVVIVFGAAIALLVTSLPDLEKAQNPILPTNPSTGANTTVRVPPE